jgi:hypothetical protein
MSRAMSAWTLPSPVTIASRPIEHASTRPSRILSLISNASNRRSMSSAIAVSLSLVFATPTKGESVGTVKEPAGSPTRIGSAA